MYSNTGGQASKSTPRGAVAKYASGGKPPRRKTSASIAMTYGNIYVGCVAMGAKDEHTLKTFLEAEAYDGPAIIIAYSHCIAHGINMATGLQNQKAAVNSGHWLLYRYNPDRAAKGEKVRCNSIPRPRIKLGEYRALENRFKMLEKSHPEQARNHCSAGAGGCEPPLETVSTSRGAWSQDTPAARPKRPPPWKTEQGTKHYGSQHNLSRP